MLQPYLSNSLMSWKEQGQCHKLNLNSLFFVSRANASPLEPNMYFRVYLGPVNMVRKGHKYVTLSQINVPRIMILSQKLGKFIWQGDIYLQRGTYIWDGGSFIWQEGTFILRRVTILLQIIRGTIFWSCVRALKVLCNIHVCTKGITKNCYIWKKGEKK